jgi:hypothetical protein
MGKLYIVNGYGVTPNSLLNNANLSLKAKGMFAFLQSKPDGWSFSVSRMVFQLKEGKDSITQVLKELEKNNFLTRKAIRKEDGTWRGYDYVLSDNPFADNPLTEGPLTENAVTLSNKDISKKDNSKKDFSFSAHRASRSSAPRATRSESEEGYEPLSPSGGEPNTNGQGEGLGRGRPQNEEDVKEAKKKEKEKKEKQEGRDINKIISAFLKHNPTISYVHKNNRDSAKVLLREFGLEPTLATIEIAIACQGEIHAPLIDNPHQLRQKLAALRTFYIRTKKKNDASIMGVPDYENNKITLEDCGG